MSLLDLHGPDITPPLYIPPVPKQRSAWGAPFRGAAAGFAEFFADVQSLDMGEDPPERRAVGRRLSLLSDEAQRDLDLERSEQRAARKRDAREARDFVARMRPEDATATAENVLFGLSRGITKGAAAIAAFGPAGALAFGGSEAAASYDELRRAGIDEDTALKVAGVTGVIGAGTVAIPMAGSTLAKTAALYVAGGPGGYIAQQALTKEILDHAGYAERARQVDILDPVGLALSALVPLPFAALGLRAARNRRAFESLKPQDPVAPVPDVPAKVPSELTPAARAVEAYPREVTDAALVLRAARPEYDAALARAEQQIQRGEPVSVADVAPLFRVEPEGALRALEANRAALEGELAPTPAGNLAERGAIREARRELALMEQTRVPKSDEAIRDRAKEIQKAERVSYKAALSAAKKEIAAKDADWQSRVEKLERFIAQNAEAQKQTQRGVELSRNILAVDRERTRLSPAVVEMATKLRAAVDEAAELPDIRQALDDIAAASRIARDMDPSVRQVAVEPTRPAKSLEPGSLDETEATAVVVSKEIPKDVTIRLDDGSMVKAADFLEKAKTEAARDALDADLVSAAVQCALTHGL